MFCCRILARIRGVEPVDIRKEDQRIRHDQLCDTRGKPVVVTIADLVGCNRVIFIDDRNDRAFEQSRQRAARIKETTSVFGIVRCQQDLCSADLVCAQHLLVGVHELHLPGCRGRLQIFEPRTTFVDSQ